MRRREFIKAIAGSAAASPLAAHAQPQAKIPVIGFLGLAPEFSGIQALRSGLRDLGYIEGRNVIIVWQWAGNVEQLPGLAAELVAIPVDVIVAPSSTFVEAARKTTTTIPIVFAVHADPVGPRARRKSRRRAGQLSRRPASEAAPRFPPTATR
jgi:ABC-type uncharacterized transport system substrate-binding protein